MRAAAVASNVCSILRLLAPEHSGDQFISSGACSQTPNKEKDSWFLKTSAVKKGESAQARQRVERKYEELLGMPVVWVWLDTGRKTMK